jgi:hypothetical protein
MSAALAASLPSEGRQGRYIGTDQKVLSRRSSLSISSTLYPDSESSLANDERPWPSSTHPPPSHSKHVATQPDRPPLLKGKVSLPRQTICHSVHAQELMERLKISWGVQYELARGVLAGRWKWDDVTVHVLERLQGSNAEAAPRVDAVMREIEGGPARRTDSRVTNLDLWWV